MTVIDLPDIPPFLRREQLSRALQVSLVDQIHAAHADAEDALLGVVECCIRAGDLLIEARRLHALDLIAGAGQ
jgi:hypothetical protein